MTQEHESLISAFKARGQEHVFQYLNEISEEEKNLLFEQLSGIDLDEVDYLVERYVKQEGESDLDFNKMEPSEYVPHFDKDESVKAQWKEAKKIGEQALREGKVAAFTVAGGQGTRLGYNGPKGTYPVTPVRQASLFEVFAKKIRYSAKHYGAPIHWFVMTSVVNHEQTVSFFEENSFFGLEPEHVHFFSQGLMPAVDFEGKLILESKNKVVMTPDGHGGSLRALNRSGSIAKMRELGVEAISYFQVDNPLVKFIDPYFIGFHLLGKSEMSSKMLAKAYALEKVGHFCDYEGKQMVVEYSDLPNEYQEQRDDKGELRFIAGSIAIHIFSVDFVASVGGDDTTLSLPFHKAVKKIPQLNEAGELEKPAEPNGVKFEMFVFDALPFAENPVLIETLREDDFSPVKNAEGVDSPESCKDHQLQMFAKWLNAAGVKVEKDGEGVPSFDFEIDPTFATDVDSFLEEWNQLTEKPVIVSGTVLEG
ncbi:MAG: UDPGP type 1 family protein [Opitutales bacterium]|nr:UDPGP type 1 family protein [Opitutales bacterium]